MAFEWNQKKYDEIVDTVCSMPRPKSEPVYMIDADKYKHLVRDVTEEYLVHPDGPFPGTKAEIKKNMEYRGKKLIKKTQQVTYYGDAIQAAIDECAKNGGG
ncbi:MAG: glycoside hydrolase family 28 protein, partial [Selenomonadaceae bacterium]|nr:glycoside hydrolase family 28 protein [Selenomonadaceae bacterium]